MGLIDLDLGKLPGKVEAWVKANPGYAVGIVAGGGVVGFLAWQQHKANQSASVDAAASDTTGASSDPYGLADMTCPDPTGASCGNLYFPPGPGGTPPGTTPPQCPAVDQPTCPDGTTSVSGTDAQGCPTWECKPNDQKPPPPDQKPPPDQHQKYTVHSGDTLSSIANRFHTSWQALYNEDKAIIDAAAHSHGHYDHEYNWIFPGEVLTI